MRKILNALCIAVVAFSFVFLVNIALYAYSPGYKNAIDKKVAGINSNAQYQESENSAIIIEIIPSKPVAETNTATAKKTQVSKADEKDTAAIVNQAVESVLGANRENNTVVETGSVSEESDENATVEETEEPYIVDRFYHEDCGNGTGYWVIQYSDGTFEVEN